MKRAPKLPKSAKPPTIKTPPARHPKTGKFTRNGVGTPQTIQPPLGPTLPASPSQGA